MWSFLSSHRGILKEGEAQVQATGNNHDNRMAIVKGLNSKLSHL